MNTKAYIICLFLSVLIFGLISYYGNTLAYYYSDGQYSPTQNEIYYYNQNSFYRYPPQGGFFVPQNYRYDYDSYPASENYNSTCDWGYQKVNGTCQKLYVPENAHWVNDGKSWACNDGYIQRGNYCERYQQVCDWGYTPINGTCTRVYIPDNAYYTDGINWRCNEGYTQNGNYCVREVQQISCPEGYYNIGSGCEPQRFNCPEGYTQTVTGFCRNIIFSETYPDGDPYNWGCPYGSVRNGNYCE